MVSEVTTSASTIAQSQQTTGQQSKQLSQDFDDFLTLLTAQLQNQDPLDPLESNEFTDQLVQFSQVEQSIGTNNKLDQLLSLELAGTSNIALGYVGLDVAYVGDLFYSNGSDPREIRYALESDAAKSTVYIRDAETREVIRTLESQLTAGAHSVTWDGKDDNGDVVEAGNYRISVDALDSNSEAVKTFTEVTGRVTGIEAIDGVVQLLLEGDALVPVSSVLSAKDPTHQAATTTTEDEQTNNDQQS